MSFHKFSLAFACGILAGSSAFAAQLEEAAHDANSGPFKLIVTEDKRPARSVRNLVSLVLRSAAY